MDSGKLIIQKISKKYLQAEKSTFTVYAIAACAVMALLFYQSLHAAILKPRSQIHETLNQTELEALQDGDIILIQGILGSADIIMNICAETVPLSHVGIIVNKNNTIFVIHTVNNTLSGIDGMQMHEIHAFIERARPHSLIVVRPLWETTTQRAKALEYVQQKLERRVPFDNAFNFFDDSALYCTELLAHALDCAGFWNSLQTGVFIKSIFVFSNFLNPQYYLPVLSHHPKFPLQKNFY
ncbi:MAG TPA: YiiX/YebB-like N1pC/P60 family cysteine hydrolase [Spirochaetia bacterium]|nr:YiiX/YebB-like N1pC/P60 family cysteine hydrolase [Spirochaetales bacterium]HRS66472.1 YiiX/YebB-like N1pC/P60 family cysteine hydrolase [Spirochaetia bacterium]HOT59014.1 YiiX/YebB-like N1pC/P60 family cysteine hydrolase [Spirochaetales bacterium]HPD80103.1 YiiX/YebB-like N1pC/P60 family cysteine hydrolase [Spirochaetales bacterium]HQG40382.1 YiiX/YebB-like N1pC/P60 family cysteine hydrolase [Spirochaetales bacterium]